MGMLTALSQVSLNLTFSEPGRIRCRLCCNWIKNSYLHLHQAKCHWCPICDKLVSKLKRHNEAKHMVAKERFDCADCGRGFRSQQGVVYHQRRVHKREGWSSKVQELLEGRGEEHNENIEEADK